LLDIDPSFEGNLPGSASLPLIYCERASIEHPRRRHKATPQKKFPARQIGSVFASANAHFMGTLIHKYL
jgi:hypothetical protein